MRILILNCRGFSIYFRLFDWSTRTVLARAVQWHCEDRVVRDGERTIVF